VHYIIKPYIGIMKKLFLSPLFLVLFSCASSEKFDTVDRLEIPKFMGDWYVLAGRFTMFEQDVHNGLETYKFNTEKNRIDIGFTYNKKSFDGEKKSLPQKGWIQNTETNAHWKVSPLWPFKFDYLVVALAEDYSWTAIGVPDQKYLWIMARDWKNPEPIINAAVAQLKKVGYNTEGMVFVPHKW
jgi:apolipoprotein D and lipocalin family protein